MNAPNQTLPDDEQRSLEIIGRCLAVARELCADPCPTAGTVALAGKALSIAAERLRQTMRNPTAAPGDRTLLSMQRKTATL